MVDHVDDDDLKEGVVEGDEEGGEDIIKVLKEREREMDALLKEARGKAASIREAAHKEAQGIKTAAAAEADAEVERIKKEEDDRMKEKLAGIGWDVEGEADEAKEKAKGRMDDAVRYVKDFVINGGGESGSDS